MTLLRRGITAANRWNERFAGRTRRRPGRSLRLFALAGFLVFLYALPEVRSVHDGLWAAWSLMLTGFVAIAPKGVYDGRLERWSREHSRLSSLLFGGLTVFVGVVVLSDLFAVRISLLMAAGLGLLMGVFSLADHKSRRNRDEGSSSGVDGEPSS